MKNMTLERITEVCGGVYYGSEADKKKEIVPASQNNSAGKGLEQ